MAKIAFIFLILTFLILPFASAKIILPQFNEAYSAGDSLDSSFEISESSDSSGLVKLKIDCGEEFVVFYTSPITLKANEAQKITVNPYTLEKEGTCKIRAELEGFNDIAESPAFKVSNAEGTASIKLGNEGYSALVKNGAFEFETQIKENFQSGENEIVVDVTDSSGNHGTASTTIKVAAIPTSLNIIINNNTFIPGEKLEASAILYDQSGKEIATAASITLYNSWGFDVAKKVLNSSENFEYTFTQKSSTGEWWIYAYAEGIRTRRYIGVKEQSAISADFINGILNITNTGNIDFKKPLEILFENEAVSEKEIEELNLGVEGAKTLRLSAPDGTYNITVKTENFEKTFTGISLTGNAISVEDQSSSAFRTAQSIVAVIIIIAFAGLAIFLKLKRAKPIAVKKVYSPSEKRFKDKE